MLKAGHLSTINFWRLLDWVFYYIVTKSPHPLKTSARSGSISTQLGKLFAIFDFDDNEATALDRNQAELAVQS